MIKKAIKKILEGGEKSSEPDTDYIVGASTGMHGATPMERLNYVASKGVNFAEIASDHPAAYTKREIDTIKRNIKSLEMKIAVHAGVSHPKITGSYSVEWRTANEEMKRFIDTAIKLKAEYLLFHSCMTPWPELENIPRRHEHLVDENGENIIKKITKRTPKLKKWFLDDFIPREIFGRGWDYFAKQEIRDKYMGKEITEEEYKKEYEKLIKKMKKEYLKDWQSDNLEKQPWRDRGIELYSYEIMGRWMSEVKDPIWRLICGKESYEKMNGKDRGRVVAAVAAKYIQGHLRKHLEKIQEKNLTITLEAPPLMNEEWVGAMKIYRPEHMAAISKTLDPEHIKITIDFEHLATQGLGPEQVLKETWNNIGSYVKNLHIGMVPTTSHKHSHVPRGDIHTYKLLWELRKKGMEHAIFIFEVGGKEEKERYGQVIVTLKDIAYYLSREVPPDELPDEFFGLTKAEMEHEKRIVDSHAFDPLRGMLELPELDYTWLSGEAVRKKQIKPDTWKKEEHR